MPWWGRAVRAPTRRSDYCECGLAGGAVVRYVLPDSEFSTVTVKSLPSTLSYVATLVFDRFCTSSAQAAIGERELGRRGDRADVSRQGALVVGLAELHQVGQRVHVGLGRAGLRAVLEVQVERDRDRDEDADDHDDHEQLDEREAALLAFEFALVLTQLAERVVHGSLLTLWWGPRASQPDRIPAVGSRSPFPAVGDSRKSVWAAAAAVVSGASARSVRAAPIRPAASRRRPRCRRA